MKKLYSAPKIQVIVIETTQMIADSMMKTDSETKSFGNSLSRESDWDE